MHAQHPSEVRLDPDQVAFYRENGYVLIPGMASEEEIASLRRVLSELFARNAGREEGAEFDMLGHDDDDSEQRQPQIMEPVNYAPELRQTPFLSNATNAARTLLAGSPATSFGHAILKPPATGLETAWHQDEAYLQDPNLECEQVSIWLPLQSVTAESGCMQYIPGSHRRDVLDHRRLGDDPRVHSLETRPDEFDKADAVACPVPAGTAIAHHGRTIHAAGPNNSDAPRFAYVLGFQLPPTQREDPRDFHWHQGVETARLQRQQSWRRRGGLVVDFERRVRNRLRRLGASRAR